MRSYCTTLLLAVVVLIAPLKAVTVLDFEGFPDSTPITTQYAGVTFIDTTVISAGISLNEFEFPPHSGTNVAFDDSGPITIDFVTPILSLGGYFTYDEPLSLDAFDSLGDQIAAANSAYSSNDALYGDPGSSPNEYIQVAFTGGISSVTIIGDPAGSSFVMDDLTYSALSGTPEPKPPILILPAFLSLIALKKIKNP